MTPERPTGASDALPVTAGGTDPGAVHAHAAAPLRWDQERMRRTRSSTVTFGPVGRVVATLLILLFLAWLVLTNLFFSVAALPAVGWALHDVWKKAPERRAPLPTGIPQDGRTPARWAGDAITGSVPDPFTPPGT